MSRQSVFRNEDKFILHYLTIVTRSGFEW